MSRKPEPWVGLSVRVRESWVVKLDELAEALSTPELAPVTRSEAVRLAVLRMHGEVMKRETKGETR